MGAVGRVLESRIERVFVGYAVPVMVQHVVAWTKAAVAEARLLRDSAQVIRTIGALLCGIVRYSRDFVKVWLPVLGVVMAVPHDMPSGCATALAVGMVADVGVDDFGSFEAIRSTYASSKNGL